MSGGSLEDVLHDITRDLPWTTRISIGLQIALGMEHLHAKQMLHRDLKSANVLLDERLKAKVCDFGLARLVQPSLEQSLFSPINGRLRRLSSSMTLSSGGGGDDYSHGDVSSSVMTPTNASRQSSAPDRTLDPTCHTQSTKCHTVTRESSAANGTTTVMPSSGHPGDPTSNDGSAGCWQLSAAHDSITSGDSSYASSAQSFAKYITCDFDILSTHVTVLPPSQAQPQHTHNENHANGVSRVSHAAAHAAAAAQYKMTKAQGSLLWMAPEMFRGDHDYGPPVDV
jgi:serine/threonine protein kinase